jgi:homocysteine S-methyltransferase
MRYGPHDLPQLGETIFLTDGGLETSLVFLDGIDLPCFAAFPLLLDEGGKSLLERYFQPYLREASDRKLGFILDTPTWRANRDWGARLGYDVEALADINRRAVEMAKSLRDAWATTATPILVNGVIGPRGDGYRPTSLMEPEEAQHYHAAQAEAFSEAGADMISAITMNYSDEATGITRAAGAVGIPVVISFTVELNGKLASGETLQAAIEKVDDETHGAPAYYMINCAHPTHFDNVFSGDEAWTRRIRGLRANASAKSHAELDEATELDPGDPTDLARRYRALRERSKQITVLGGCCGTDHRHIAAICEACVA